jgi:hypothetical protein
VDYINPLKMSRDTSSEFMRGLLDKAPKPQGLQKTYKKIMLTGVTITIIVVIVLLCL